MIFPSPNADAAYEVPREIDYEEVWGTVESIYSKEFGNTRCVNFSVATNHCYKDSDGCPIIETTWHRVIA